MGSLQHRLNAAVTRLRAAGTDLHDIEVKRAAGGLPKSVTESVSAFANGDGGLLVLGLDEATAFAAVDVDAAKLAADLAAACVEQLDPPIRADIDIAVVDGKPVVVASIDELPANRKPCYVRSRGMDRGSYLRTHDGDRLLSTYEVHVLASSHGQPAEDAAVVPGASIADLDPILVAGLVHRLRTTRAGPFADADDTEILRLMGVVVDATAGSVSVAGLLALGRYPQRFLPQLDITFVAYPTVTGAPLADGTRFIDNQSIDGPVPTMVADALAVLRRNMTRRSIIVGLGREDRWEYPEEAIRELVANALMHRDYHPSAHGTQVRISLYPDRLEIASPGGLYGPIIREDLGAEPISSSRNARLAKLLEDVEVTGTNRTVCENRGSGLIATAAALRTAGIEPPELIDTVREFKAIIRHHSLLDDNAINWLATIDTVGLNDHQRLALAFMRRTRTITNQQHRTLTGSDALTATRDLSTLASRGLVVKVSDRRWTVWHLADAADATPPPGTDTTPSATAGPRQDRRREIRTLLAAGPESARAIATSLGVTREGALRWLRRMEADGEVAPTNPSRHSKQNLWQLTDMNR